MSNELIPFVSSVANEFNERLDEVLTLINEITDSMKNYTESIQSAINDIGNKIFKMLEESSNTKKSINEGYLQIIHKIAGKIKQVKEGPIKADDRSIKEILETSSRIADKLNENITELQLIQIINGLNTVVDRIETAIQEKRQIAVPKPVIPQTTGKQTNTGTVTEQETSAEVYYEQGSKTKTMDEILEEQRKRKKMFQQYR